MEAGMDGMSPPAPQWPLPSDDISFNFMFRITAVLAFCEGMNSYTSGAFHFRSPSLWK